jgi:hypothetical protein
MLHIAVNNASCFETDVLERDGANTNGVRCPSKYKLARSWFPHALVILQ